MAAYKMRSVFCPVCQKGKLLNTITINGERLPQIYAYPPTLRHRARHFIKCPICKNQIGLSLKS